MAWYLSVKDTFSMAHTIPGHPKCGNIHGHNFKVKVMFKCKGEPDTESGMVVDFAILKEIVQSITQKEFDHHFIKELTLLSGNKVPVSAEYLSFYLYHMIALEISKRKLKDKIEIEMVRVCETDNFCAVYKNE